MAGAEMTLRCTKEPYIEDVGPRKIKSIRFSTFSGDEIRKAAEVQVWKSNFYDAEQKTVQNGLLDTRMGPTKGNICATCHGPFAECPGHFGYLKLTLPVFNIGYLNSILNILKCICKCCSRILLPENERKEYLKKMRNPKVEILQKNALVKKIRDKCKASRCTRCGYVNGVTKKARAGSIALVEDFTKIRDESVEEYQSALSHLKEKSPWNARHVLSPDRVLALFKQMLYEDCELLHLNDRPEKLIITDIAVPPVAIRPSYCVDFGRTSQEDSISSMLREIIITNSILRDNLEGVGAPPEKCMETWELLQVELAEYINSEAPGVVDSKHRGFVQRLKGKQGRFRGNLSGKRVEFTGRTVISPDPNLKITEVGVPILMARVLTYPERVNQHNIEKLRKRVKNGPSKYPGANFVIHPGGTRIYLKYERKNVANELKYGYIVERHLEDGDIVLFNRQPSLHRMSIMSHRAKVMPWRTLRFNESVCNPYNADFDGDEMNMHVPQTEEARTEAVMLMGVQNNLCTPKNGQILVASTQDFLTSSFLISRRDTFYDRASFSLMCSYMGDAMEHIDLPTPSIIKPMELWTGKQLFNVLVRPNAQTKVFLNLAVKEKAYKSGETMCISDSYVYFRNSELISGQLGKTTLGNGSSNGLFSVLINDYGVHAAASCMNRLAKLSARWIGNHGFSIGIDDVQPGENLYNQTKLKIDNGYKTCEGLIFKYSKGDLPPQPGCDAAQTLETEVTQVLNKIRDATAVVCMEVLHWRNSPLIMSQCGSKGSSVNICQMIGCVGQQSVGGRRAPNGFIDRTLPHFHRNSKTPAAKGFVANSFYSGLTATEFFFHTMGGREGLVDTAVKTAETGYMSRRLMKSLEDLSVYYDQTVRNASGGIVQFLYGDDGMDPAKMEGNNEEPLNLDQLFGKIMATCPSDSTTLPPSEIRLLLEERLSKPDMNPEGGCSKTFRESIIQFVENIARSLEKTRKILKLDDDQNEVPDLNTLERLSAHLSGISLKQLKLFLDTCVSRYHSKRIEAGAAVGAIGAQSIGEPGTQMTLKTFHFAGLASMNITLGVPRIKEIINATKNISTPFIEATLECDDDAESAKKVKVYIEKTLLGEVATSIKIVLKSTLPYLVITLDVNLINALDISAYSVQQSILQHPRIKVKKEHIHVPTGCKLRISPSQKKDVQSELHALMAILPKVIVKGIPSVKRAVIVNENKKGDTSEGKPEYKLYVEGTNLLAVMGTPGIKGTATKSNHVIEVQQTLGIEAARKCIIDEINKTMKSHGMNIDIRHMMLLADVMTYKGEVLGITRFGITKMKDSVLMLASFEKTAEHLFNASVNGREDQIDGVSECIIMGIPMQLGTGMLKVLQRTEVPELKYGPDPIFS